MSKLDGIKAGDRVRVTFEGTMDSGSGRFSGVLGQHADVCFSPNAMEDSTFQITRIEPAFKVGDEVRTKGDTRHMEVIAILNDGRLVVEYQAGDSTNVMARDPSCFKRA